MTGTARFAAGVLGFLMALAAARPAEEGAKEAGRSKPPWQRYLQGDDARKAVEQDQKLDELIQAGDLAEAVKVAEGLAELRRKVQGADHWEAVNARWSLAALRRIAGQGEGARKEYLATVALAPRAADLRKQGRYREAQAVDEKLLAFSRKVIGEEYPTTARGYNNLATSLALQGKYAEAGDYFQKALAIRRKLLGEDHPDTASSYDNLAANLHHQGKYREAEEGHRKALAICCKVLGEEDLLLADMYNNLAAIQEDQGKYAQAEALAEAKAWLRDLTHEEATSHAGRLSGGAARGEGGGRGKGLALPVPAAPPAAAGDAASRNHPFAHPYYWAAFVLVGHAD